MAGGQKDKKKTKKNSTTNKNLNRSVDLFDDKSSKLDMVFMN